MCVCAGVVSNFTYRYFFSVSVNVFLEIFFAYIYIYIYIYVCFHLFVRTIHVLFNFGLNFFIKFFFFI